MEIESITASAAWGAVMTPQAASASAAGSVPMSGEGNSAKLSFMAFLKAAANLLALS